MLKQKKGKKGKAKLCISCRHRGHSYELQVVNELKKLGYTAQTSRYADRSRDDAGVDIVTNAPLNIQCKCTNTFKNPLPFLEHMPIEMKPNVVFNKIVHQAELVIMSTVDFYHLLTLAHPSDKLTKV